MLMKGTVKFIMLLLWLAYRIPDTSVMSQHPILFSRARQTAVVIMEAFPELENEKENYVLIFWPSDLNRIFME